MLSESRLKTLPVPIESSSRRVSSYLQERDPRQVERIQPKESRKPRRRSCYCRECGQLSRFQQRKMDVQCNLLVSRKHSFQSERYIKEHDFHSRKLVVKSHFFRAEGSTKCHTEIHFAGQNQTKQLQKTRTTILLPRLDLPLFTGALTTRLLTKQSSILDQTKQFDQQSAVNTQRVFVHATIPKAGFAHMMRQKQMIQVKNIFIKPNVKYILKHSTKKKMEKSL